MTTRAIAEADLPQFPAVFQQSIGRLFILLALLVCGLGTVFFIPRQTKIQPCRVRMQLPELIGGWAGKPAAVSPLEHAILASDTQFCRKVYDDGFGDQVLVSIVLSGHDLDSSIHRPERCLPAQGWTIVDSTSKTLPVAEAPGGRLPVTRLYDVKQRLGPAGNVVNVYNLNYYWFIGYSDITASHFEREYIDIRDRLLHGYNQRWAYVTVAANVNPADQARTDQIIEGLIARVYPKIVTETGAGDAVE
jgi:EpsI family protein